MLELKLDATTTFEWQRYSQETLEVPHFTRLLDFLNLWAQASESSAPEFAKKQQVENATLKRNPTLRSIAAYAAAVDDACVVCKANKHPLYACQRYRTSRWSQS